MSKPTERPRRPLIALLLLSGWLLLALALLLLLSYFVAPLLPFALPRPNPPLVIGAGTVAVLLLVSLPRPSRVWLLPALQRRFQWDGDASGPGYPRTGLVKWLRRVLEIVFALVVLQYFQNVPGVK